MTKTTILALAGAISGLLMAAPAVSAADAMPKVSTCPKTRSVNFAT